MGGVGRSSSAPRHESSSHPVFSGKEGHIRGGEGRSSLAPGSESSCLPVFCGTEGWANTRVAWDRVVQHL